MSGTKNLGAYIPSSPAVWLENGELRIEWRQLFTQLWERTGGSQGTPPASGTITGVTAGAGLAGGGTTGTVTISLTIPVTIGNGGTGATTAPQALMNLGALPVAGGAMTGALTLAADPAAAMQPVTLQYYNAHLPAGTVASITAGAGLTGGTITTSGTIALSVPVAVASGGTNATTAAQALVNLGAIPTTTDNVLVWG